VGFDFIVIIKLSRRLTWNEYIIVVIDYAIKWVEAKALRTKFAIVTAIFMFKYILTKFGCPLTIVINQGAHFINDTIKHLIEQFLLKYVSSTYYPHGNGQADFTNKFIGRLFTKLVNEKKKIGMNICPQSCFHIGLFTR
jgi:hypothetical protein